MIRVSGEIDLSNEGFLAERVASITAARPDRIIFDLRGVTFMGSCGIRILAEAVQQAGSVYIRPSDAAMRLIDLSGLIEWVSIER